MTSKTSKLLLTTILSCGIALGAAQANAAGFYLQEQSVEGVGAANAGATSNLNNATTVWFNPANLTKLDGVQVSAGAQVLFPFAKLEDRGSTAFGAPTGPLGGGDNPFNPEVLPNLYMSVPVNDRLTFGLGLNSPFGLSLDYGDSWFGQFDSTSTDLMVANTSAVLAYKVSSMLSIAGGLDVQYADARLEERAFVGAGTVGTGTLKGDDTSLGFNLSATVDPTPTTTIGAMYRYGVTHKLKGHLMLAGTSTPADYDDEGTAELNLPDIYSLGITQRITPQTRVMGNVTYYHWSSFENINPQDTTTSAPVSSTGVPIPIFQQNYKNTTSLAIGAEHDLNPQWTIRAGYQFDPTPTQDGFRDTRVPDGDRNWLSTGASYKLNQQTSIDMAAVWVFVKSEDVVTTRNVLGAPPANATTRANIDGHVGIVSVALNYKF